MKNIETLARQLDLYKSKSSPEVDRKIAALESKAKQDAKELKAQNEHLQEMNVYNEEKNAQLQQEIDRLKIVLRTEAEARMDQVPSRPATAPLQHLEKKYVLTLIRVPYSPS